MRPATPAWRSSTSGLAEIGLAEIGLAETGLAETGVGVARG
jgi:hypothetical protein